MSAATMLLPSVSKEVRALALPWLACTACMLGITISNSPRVFGPLAVIAYLVGTVALGALSIGHEYTGRTLSVLLTLPARRERLLATKLGVLIVMLLALWVVAETFVFRGMPGPADGKQMILLIPLVCGLCLAPWLTMVCRSPIAGAVFALTIPGILMVVGELVGVATYGHGPVMQTFLMTFMWFTTLGLCVVGAVLSWRMFTRLEAIDGRGQDVRLPHWLIPGSSIATAEQGLTRRNPVWLLVKKELRLQQLPLVLTALYVVESILVVWAARVLDAKYGYLFASLAILHAGLLPLLIGSSASAGERQIDTLQSQLLLPMAALKQWAVKVAVVFGLTLGLAILLPASLAAITRWTSAGAVPLMQMDLVIIATLLLSAGSLYVSSLCRSGLWALIMSMPALVASALFLQLSRPLGTAAYLAVRQFTATATPQYASMDFIPSSYLVTAGFIAIALRFAFINHRSADRPAKRVLMQVIVMAVFVAAGIAAGAAWQALR